MTEPMTVPHFDPSATYGSDIIPSFSQRKGYIKRTASENEYVRLWAVSLKTGQRRFCWRIQKLIRPMWAANLCAFT